MEGICPADSDRLKRVILHDRQGQHAHALMCDTCGGAFLEVGAQAVLLGSALKVDPASAVPSHHVSPRTGKAMHHVVVGEIGLEACLETHAIWFGAGKLVLVKEMIRQYSGEHAVTTGARPGPADGLRVRCADCDVRDLPPDEVADAGFGLICKRCQRTEATSPLDHLGATVSLHESGDRAANPAHYHARVEVTLPFGGLVEAQLTTLSFWQSFMRFLGRRGARVGHPAVEACYFARSPTPDALRDFISTHGVVELLLLLSDACERSEVLLERSRFVVSAWGWQVDPARVKRDPRLSVDALARRLFERLRRFHATHGVALPHDATDQWTPRRPA